jgi:hypothetical protein
MRAESSFVPQHLRGRRPQLAAQRSSKGPRGPQFHELIAGRRRNIDTRGQQIHGALRTGQLTAPEPVRHVRNRRVSDAIDQWALLRD